ncbi:MAG: cell wall hydrolase [Enterocloster asparagiformis]|nr:cell wall hydrolase [Enterocloster asparagiformis]
MNRFLFLFALVSALYCFPVYGQDKSDPEKVTAEQFERLLDSVTDTYTMYSNTDGVNIRKEPNVESDILSQALLNTSFEVIIEIEGWSMITTENGFAYIKSDYLSSEESEIPQYTENDLYVLAHLICGEAQGCSDEEQRYVGSVVLNRVKHPEFPDTIEAVVYEPGQYACVSDGNYDRDPTEANWENARWLLENGSVLPDKVIWQSRGKQGKGVYIKTKWHSYCY